jgi:hypothetical protein
MKISSSSLTPPFYKATIDFSAYSFPAIPPKGWSYYARIIPDPTGADCLVPYTCTSELGINDEIPIDDGHDLQSQAWTLSLLDARMGILSNAGNEAAIDAGAADLADWFKLTGFTGESGKFLHGTIKMDCDKEGITVRLMQEGQLAATGTSLYEASIGSGDDSATLTIPDGVIPSIPSVGTHYYIVVHNAGIPGWAPYGLTLNLSIS